MKTYDEYQSIQAFLKSLYDTEDESTDKLYDNKLLMDALRGQINLFFRDLDLQEPMKVQINPYGQSYTNGEKITIGLPHELEKYKLSVRYAFLEAILAHETQHVKSSDFECFGDMDEIIKLFKEELVRQGENPDNYDTEMAKSFYHYILNVIEDGRIEYILSQDYEGIKNKLKVLNLAFYVDNFQDSEFENRLGFVLSNLWTYSKLRLFHKDAEDYPSDWLYFIEEIAPHVDKAIYSKDFKVCRQASIDIYNTLLTTFVEDVIKNHNERQLDRQMLRMLRDLLEKSKDESHECHAANNTIQINSEDESEEDKSNENKKDNKEQEQNKESLRKLAEQIRKQMEENEKSKEESDKESGSNQDSNSNNQEDSEEKAKSSSTSNEGSEEGEESSQQVGSQGQESEENSDENKTKDENQESENQDSGDEAQEKSKEAKGQGSKNDTESSSDQANGQDEEENADHEGEQAKQSQEGSKSNSGIGSGSVSNMLSDIAKDLNKEEETVNTLNKLEAQRVDALEKDSFITKREKESISEYYGTDIKLENDNIKNFITPSLPDSNLLGACNRFKSDMERVFKANESYNRVDNLEYGMLDTDEIYRVGMGSRNVFYEEDSFETRSFAINILCDFSGSMCTYVNSEGSRFNHALKALTLLEYGLKDFVPLQIAGFTNDTPYGGDDVSQKLSIIKKFNDKSSGKKTFSSSANRYFAPDDTNADFIALDIARRQLMRRSEQDKIMFVISDGLPYNIVGKNSPSHKSEGFNDFSVADMETAIAKVKQMSTDIVKKGIVLIPILILSNEYNDQGQFLEHIQRENESSTKKYMEMYNHDGIKPIICRADNLAHKMSKEISKIVNL